MMLIAISVALLTVANLATCTDKHPPEEASAFQKLFKRGIFGFGGGGASKPSAMSTLGGQGASSYPSTIAVKYPSGQAPPAYASVMQSLSPFGGGSGGGQGLKGFFGSGQNSQAFSSGYGGGASGPSFGYGGSNQGFGQYGQQTNQQYSQPTLQSFGQQNLQSFGQQNHQSYGQQNIQSYGQQQPSYGQQNIQPYGQQFGQQFGQQSNQQYSSSPLKVSSFSQPSQYSSNPYPTMQRPYSNYQSSQAQQRPYRITIPQPVQVTKPYPVQVLRPVPVSVPYPVHVLKPYRVEVPHPIPVQVPQPFNVQVPVPVQQNVPVNQQFDGQGYGNDYGQHQQHQQQQQQQQQQGYGQQSGYVGETQDFGGSNFGFSDFNNNQDQGKWQAVVSDQGYGGNSQDQSNGQQYGGNYGGNNGGSQQEYGYGRRSDRESKALKESANSKKS